MANEVVLEIKFLTVVFSGDLGGNGVITHGEQADTNAHGLAKGCGGFGQGEPLCEELTAKEVGGEIKITKGKPRFTTEFAETLHGAPRLTFDSPASLGVVESGQGVAHRVEVGTNGQAMEHEVVAGVDDGRDLGFVNDVHVSSQKSSGTDATTEGHNQE